MTHQKKIPFTDSAWADLRRIAQTRGRPTTPELIAQEAIEQYVRDKGELELRIAAARRVIERARTGGDD